MPAIELNQLSLSLSPAGYYKLEDVNDSSGNSKTLTDAGSTSFVAAKFNNGSNHVLGDGDFFTRTDNYGIAGGASASFSFWIKTPVAPTSGQVYGIFIHRSQLTTDRFISFAYENSGGTLRVIVNNSGTSTTYNVDLGTTLFHNIVLVRNTTASFNLYIDGVDTGATSSQGATTAGSEVFGLATNGAVDPTAILDDVGIFVGALTAADATLIYNGPTDSNEDRAFFI